MNAEFLEDVHVRKALHTLQGAIEASAKLRGTEMMFLYVVSGTKQQDCGLAAVGHINPSSAMIASSYLMHVINSADGIAPAVRAH